MSDDEREAHILACGELMMQALRRYHQSRDLADRAEADSWLRTMEDAIKGRSAARVAQMESNRGLADA